MPSEIITFENIRTAQRCFEDMRTDWQEFFARIKKEGNLKKITTFSGTMAQKVIGQVYNDDDKNDIGYQAIAAGSADNKYYDFQRLSFDQNKWQQARRAAEGFLRSIVQQPERDLDAEFAAMLKQMEQTAT